MEDYYYNSLKEEKVTLFGRKLEEFRFTSTCKNCGAWISHVSLWNDMRTKEGKLGNCSQYIPSDNLEYLEWLYNKKHGLPISIY